MKKHDQEFKDEAVSLTLSSGRPLIEIALDC
jgi:transposase-like protein